MTLIDIQHITESTLQEYGFEVVKSEIHYNLNNIYMHFYVDTTVLLIIQYKDCRKLPLTVFEDLKETYEHIDFETTDLEVQKFKIMFVKGRSAQCNKVELFKSWMYQIYTYKPTLLETIEVILQQRLIKQKKLAQPTVTNQIQTMIDNINFLLARTV